MPRLTVFLFLQVLLGAGTAAASQEYDFRTWGKEALEVIERDHATGNDGFYFEDQSKRNLSFIWGKGKLLIAYAQAAQVEPAYNESVSRLIDGIDRYWVEHEGIGGYNPLPNPRNPGRYYDDNAWVAMGLIDAYEAIDNEEYLEQAKKTLDFALSGKDESGGIFWREYHKDTLNTCSVAPTAYGCLRYYQITHDEYYLQQGKSLMEWLDANLKDDDGLYFDNVHVRGRIGRRKWTYNAGMPLQNYVLLYELTEDDSYLDKAVALAESSKNHWYDSRTGAIACESMFAWTLVEGWVQLSEITGDSHWKDVAGKSLSFLYNEVRDPNGRYPLRWDDNSGREIRRWKLLYPAGAAKAYWTMAAAK